MPYTSRTTAGFNRRPLMWATIAVFMVTALTITTLEATNTTHIFHKNKAAFLNPSNNTPTTGAASANIDKGEPTMAPGSTSGSVPQTQPGDTKSNQGSSASADVVKPSGEFVSNHHPNLSGTPAPNLMSSVCTTTPGAKCAIQFISGNTVKSLPSQTTDRGGSAYWNWKLQDIGLTAGSWKIEAIATLNGKTIGANDALELVVSQ